MPKNNINEIAILNEELASRKKVEFKMKNNPIKICEKIRKIIFHKIQEINLIEDKVIKDELIDVFDELIENKIEDVKNHKDINLMKQYKTRREIRGIKERLMFPEKSAEMQLIYQKELIYNEVKTEKIIAKKNKLKDQKNVFSKKRHKNAEIKIAKLKIRRKDLYSFVKNKSVLKKVYLSDEPPLTPMGWLKLMLSYGFMILWSMMILWPIAELLKDTLNVNAKMYLNTTAEYKFGFTSFTRLFNETDFTSWLLNTLIVAGITSVSTVALALLMGYAFSRFRFKGKRSSLMSVMLLQMVPSIAALTVFYVLFTILREQFDISGLTVLILIYVGGGMAGNTFIMKGYMDSISLEIDEAARIDGLSQWRIFTRIIAPLTKPMIALVALWSFVGPFGDFVLPGLLLDNSKEFTLAKGLQTLASNPETQDQGAFAAGAVLVAVPISILFIALRKFLVGGMTAGGVKG